MTQRKASIALIDYAIGLLREVEGREQSLAIADAIDTLADIVADWESAKGSLSSET